MVISFGRLFDRGVKPGGVYVVEDIHATYWTSYRDVPFAFSEFCRDLINLMHASYWRSKFDNWFTPIPGRTMTVPRLSTLIDRLDIVDSIVAIHKKAGMAELRPHGYGRDFSR